MKLHLNKSNFVISTISLLYFVLCFIFLGTNIHEKVFEYLTSILFYIRNIFK